MCVSPKNYTFTGMSVDAAEWIVKNRGLTAIGQDCIAFDPGQMVDYKRSVHTVGLFFYVCPYFSQQSTNIVD